MFHKAQYITIHVKNYGGHSDHFVEENSKNIMIIFIYFGVLMECSDREKIMKL